LQLKLAASPVLDLSGVVERVRDLEVDGKDSNLDNAATSRNRFQNDVYGFKFGFHPSSKIDIRGMYNHSEHSRIRPSAPGHVLSRSPASRRCRPAS